jgi:O-acetylserine/cysteine efflux transporter
MPLRELALFALVCLIWAVHTVLAKVVLSGMEIPPLYYAALRYCVVLLVVFPWLWPAPRPRWRLVVVGFLMGGGGFALFFMGMKTASPSGSAVVQQLAIPMTALLSFLMRGERIDRRRGIGMFLTFVGAVTVMWDPGGLSLTAGLVLIAGSALISALATVLMKQTRGVEPMQFQAWVGLTSGLPLLALSAAVETGQIERSLEAGWGFVAAVLYSALVVSVVGHTVYYGLIRRHDANLVAPLMVMNPVMTVVLGILVTGDAFGPQMWLGTALALAGVLIITVPPERLRRLPFLRT